VTSLHDDRGRACSFGADPERYDRSRPRYPAELITFLLADQPRQVLDVGCGTGIASRLFAARGCDVLGVEPDVRMAEVARRHGIAVEAGRLEDWDPRGRRFDLVISGQAWHWVEPVAGTRAVAAALRPAGRFGAFWNAGHHRPALRARFDEIYARLAPGLDKHSVALGNMSGEPFRRAAAALRANGSFTEPESLTFTWHHTYSRDAWLDQLPTHSDHAALPADRRDHLLSEIGTAIDAEGGNVAMTFDTWLVTARRSGD
jgi:SAM-dependent methyltransferase